MVHLFRCKVVRKCYQEMLSVLRVPGESACIEDASIGAGSVMIYLRALKQFCGEIVTFTNDYVTYEGRHLYQVVLNTKKVDVAREDEKSVIFIDAGQQADTETVEFALYLIEQLVACQENNDMIYKTKWIILPSTNPDGQEYARFYRSSWSKNMKMSDDKMSYGVDISRNFDNNWGSCKKIKSGFSSVYPGPSAASETETTFIQAYLNSYKSRISAYLSLRRNGHGIYYPCANTDDCDVGGKASKMAGDIAAKVNARAGSIQVFGNSSIYKANGKSHCGHSVDYAKALNIPLAFEMRMFLGTDNAILSRFQNLPKGFESTLRTGYFSGIRELYNKVVNQK